MSDHRFNFIVIFLKLWKKNLLLIFFQHTEISNIYLFISSFYITVNNNRHHFMSYNFLFSLLSGFKETSCFSSFSYLESFSCFKTFLKLSWNIKIEHLWQICFEHISHFRIQGDLVVCGISLLISWWMATKATKCTQYSTSSEDRWSQINSIPNQFLIC